VAGPAPTLDRRSLNCALLARQWLLEKRRASADVTLEHLVGMQAQAPDLPYVGLWARLEGFRQEKLSRLIEVRSAVRLSLMRNTIHLVTARDAVRLKPLFMPLGERGYLHGSPWGRHMRRVDLAAIQRAGREIMGEKPRTVAELAKLLGERIPQHDPHAMAYGVRYTVPLVFTPPRGIWGANGPVNLTTFEAWLERSPGPAIAPQQLVRRYLAAFGPASPADMHAWSGLAMRPVFERLRTRLTVLRDENGTELFDLPRAPRPGGDVPTPIRLLPDFDNILLAHRDRTRIMPEGRHLGMFSSNGLMQGSVLVDGFVRAMWRPNIDQHSAAMVITPFVKPLPKPDQLAIEAQSRALLEFIAPDRRHEVRFGPVKP
jgi:hypothetical protein